MRHTGGSVHNRNVQTNSLTKRLPCTKRKEIIPMSCPSLFLKGFHRIREKKAYFVLWELNFNNTGEAVGSEVIAHTSERSATYTRSLSLEQGSMYLMGRRTISAIPLF